MRQFFIVPLLLILPICLVSVLSAEELFVMKEREWKEVYAVASHGTEASLPLSFTQVTEIARGEIPDRLTGKTVEIQGYFEMESDSSFRLHQDNDPIFKHCSSCVKKKERESPRIFAPLEVIQKLKPGLVRVRGAAKYRPLALTVEEPVLEIQAQSISISVE